MHKRPEAYKKLAPGALAYYDGVVKVDLSRIEPMIALPFHPSNTYTIRNLIDNAGDILREVEKTATEQLDNPNIKVTLTDKITPDGIRVDQGVIAGCAGGTFDNLCAAADILAGQSTGSGAFTLSAYPASQPAYIELVRNGAAAKLMEAGVTLRTAFCGPCFGAGDVPANGGLSIRHSTRNFPNREGSKPGNGQIASVALMDARSIAATAARGGILTPATELELEYTNPTYHFDSTVYDHRVYKGYGNAKPETALRIGPNIADWPVMSELTDDMLLKVASVINDPVTTTDELIPSGETSSYRSNPLKLAEFALSRKDPAYVGRAKEVQKFEKARENGDDNSKGELADIFSKLADIKAAIDPMKVGVGSVVCARKPGDGSAREQAASCQKVLGGWANIAVEYATKRYRSNLINWGMLPFIFDNVDFEVGDYVFVPDIRATVEAAKYEFPAYVIKADGSVKDITLKMGELTDDERKIILCGCLINYYKDGN